MVIYDWLMNSLVVVNVHTSWLKGNLYRNILGLNRHYRQNKLHNLWRGMIDSERLIWRFKKSKTFQVPVDLQMIVFPVLFHICNSSKVIWEAQYSRTVVVRCNGIQDFYHYKEHQAAKLMLVINRCSLLCISQVVSSILPAWQS